MYPLNNYRIGFLVALFFLCWKDSEKNFFPRVLFFFPYICAPDWDSMKYNEKKIDPDPTSSDPGPDDGLGSRMITRNAGSATQRVTPGHPGHEVSPELLPNVTFCLLRKIKIVWLYYFKCLYI